MYTSIDISRYAHTPTHSHTLAYTHPHACVYAKAPACVCMCACKRARACVRVRVRHRHLRPDRLEKLTPSRSLRPITAIPAPPTPCLSFPCRTESHGRAAGPARLRVALGPEALE